MIQFKTLEDTTFTQLVKVFNEAFSDYFVKIQLTEELLCMKMRTENIDLEYSIGAFHQGRLVGFILHGEDQAGKRLYNGGTGVIPKFRGQALTVKMYEYALPLLRNKGFDKFCLEVICDNAQAVKSYERVGFRIVRKLNCYSGELSVPATSKAEIQEADRLEWNKLQLFWDVTPTWQHDIAAATRIKNHLKHLIAVLDDQIKGYAVYNPQSKRLLQIAVEPESRNLGIGKSLLHYIATHYSNQLSVINVDEQAEDIHALLSKAGLQTHLAQFEMVLS